MPYNYPPPFFPHFPFWLANDTSTALSETVQFDSFAIVKFDTRTVVQSWSDIDSCSADSDPSQTDPNTGTCMGQ